MSLSLTIVCLFLASHINGQEMFSDDTGAAYNPCQTDSGVFFYPHPTDSHQYYQCDEAGIAYLRSCGDLVWDEIHVACNWPSVVEVTVARGIIPTSPSFITTSTTAVPYTVTVSRSTATNSPSSLCFPVNPCGEHGNCIESPSIVPIVSRRFACFCKDNWFGRLCDQSLLDLTTPPPPTTTPQSMQQLDQTNDILQIANTLLLPVPLPEKSNETSDAFHGSEKLKHLDSPRMPETRI